ncbi:MAG: 4-methylaminobutanoate oxidase (formaldehyde-forming) [Gammaproteobacteria bacterium]|nr:4-methylaminobutanoate oxidase (formaldehyde-forming) [Gammaproteobacteria bacterium]
MQSQTRVVIVGGGILGCGLLYHLAEEGWTDSLLIEKGELTSGSTWHAAGQCPSFIADYNMAKIHDYGVRLYPKLEELTGQYVSWHGSGGIRFATKPAEVQWFHHVASIGKLIGFHCEVIDVAKIKQINPFVNTDGVLAGAWTTEDGHVDPAGCCNALAKGARRMGATIVTKNRVLDIKQRSSGEWEVFTEQGNVVCEMVVNAAGCYARRVSRMVGTDIPITNMKHTYIVTDTVPEFMDREEEIPVMRDPFPSAYYRQEQKSGLIGIYETRNSEECWTHRGGRPDWESENELFEADFDNLAVYLQRAMERMPIWSELGIKQVICGAIPHTPDANPFLGPAAGLKNYWHCNGASIGIASGAGCGKYLAQWMVYGDSEINMSGVDPRRFGQYAPGDYTKAKSHQDYEHMYALHLPGEERPASRNTRVTPLYDRLLEHGCVYTEVNGWERPKWFSVDGRVEEPGFRHNNVFELVAEECRAVRERVGVLDLSSFAKYEVTGTDAEQFLNRVSANRMPKRDGGIALSHYLSSRGRIAGESTITRLGKSHYYILSGAGAEDRDMDHLTRGIKSGEDVVIKNVTGDWAVLVVAGPKSRDILSGLTESDLSNVSFKWLTAQEIDIANVPVRALRVNYVGELGWELHCPMSRLTELYEQVWSTGQSHGIADFGAYAVNSLRMEKAYKSWSTELTNEITMIEAGMERFFSSKKSDFVGKASTLKVKEQGISTKLVYLEVEPGNCDVQGGEPVFDGEQVIGVTTSGGYGHYTGKNLGFAYVSPNYADDGCHIGLEILGERRWAKVLAEPVWDPNSERLRA